MTELIWSPQALRDLEGIRAYIALDSPLSTAIACGTRDAAQHGMQPAALVSVRAAAEARRWAAANYFCLPLCVRIQSASSASETRLSASAKI